jgi:membrane associated rhomboid family serine protease
MLPLHDDNPTTTRPVVTIGLIGLCLLVFFHQFGLPEDEATAFVLSYGFLPVRLFHDAFAQAPFPLGPEWTLVTSMFLHGGIMHLAGNMLVLWVFGNNVEDAMGPVRFLIFYLLGGMAATLIHGLSEPLSPVPMVGASGAIAAVMGAYILLYPRARVLCWAWILVLRLPAVVFLGLWFALQVYSAMGNPDGGVAWWAHIGGFLVGMLLVVPFKRRGVRLFNPSPQAMVRTAAFGAGRRGTRFPESTGPVARPPVITVRMPGNRSRIPPSGPRSGRRGPWS